MPAEHNDDPKLIHPKEDTAAHERLGFRIDDSKSDVDLKENGAIGHNGQDSDWS
ncbi:hypothetical protein [Paenibacillus hamazuiensis]|uniref:hypothetical protein n=1 Tax=Paenibacillus hamazuiensis TaxID=2936508 RepID=UPI00200CC068|nr:hypothetical protein [Paenibacillus hamazuiensis]